MGESVFSTMRNSPRTRTSGTNGRSAGSGWVNVDELAAGATSFDDIVGAVKEIHRLEAEIRQLGAARSSVLISGESGTGKEMLAKALHRNGSQAASSLIVINCACLNEARPGVNPARDLREIVEHEGGGTILFDHIGELNPEAQQTLSEALHRSAAIGALRRSRIMATTSRDVRELAARGLFRPELLDYTAESEIWIAPLRERPDDISAMIGYFFRYYS
ncbi:MAG TPA: sigma 54-interacting transcriptional regulator, partial [Candidatus Binataceae bacterium]|nr:sigma 54-interacting transcriptional regulator [Candidatus Binataceae bacterium]